VPGGLTVELTGSQRHDASAQLAKMYRVPCTVYRRPGAGGVSLVLRLSEGLGTH
jgi:hypothetical protein